MKQLGRGVLVIGIMVVLLFGFTGCYYSNHDHWDRNDHDEFEDEMEAFGNEMEEFGEDMGQWGEDFGEDMADWGEDFGRDMADWGTDFGVNLGDSIRDDLHHIFRY
jgi:hypothetical protein